MYSNVTFYKKNNGLHEIHFPVRLGGLKGVNASGDNSDTSYFDEIKIILLMFTGRKVLYLGMITDLIICKWEDAESHISSVNWFDKSLYFRVLIISRFSFLIALLSISFKIYIHIFM